MKTKLFLQLKDALVSILPISISVLLINFTIAPMPFHIRSLFLIGSVLLIIGMAAFTLGADIAMMPAGEHIGAQLTKSKKVVMAIGICLVMGTIVTLAEPDLHVLAGQVVSIPKSVLIVTVAMGVGVFLMISLLRIYYQWNLSYLFIFFYFAAFGIGAFASENFFAVAFDAGGVTTGPVTVPFILALGIGLSAVRGGKSSHDDSFGLLGLCSVGPVISVMCLGLFYDSSAVESVTVIQPKAPETVKEVFQMFAEGFPVYFSEVAISLAPVLIFFILFQLIYLKLPKSQIIKIGIGILYTYLGLVVFLTGVNIGFLPTGAFIGEYLGGLSYKWILIPVSMIVGFFIVAAEPAVHVLNNQVEEISGGAISKNAMLYSLSIGVAVSTGLAIIRILYSLSIWYFLLPGYLIALALTLFTPKIFVAIAFDSGGVASGTMTATFLLPFATGATLAVGGNVLTDAFGIIAMVAMTPLITIQIMGLIYEIKIRFTEKEEEVVLEEIAEDIEEEAFIDLQYNTSTTLKDHSLPDNSEHIERVKNGSDLRIGKHYNDIINDNDYIDFVELEKLVLPEDFEFPHDKKPENT
ncbi:MAG: DUF1538 domain-containing protein [Eubacteriales bacterium]|nr:DUF1538 domain-containing protein [Eubacteriales bacterium]